MSEPMTVQQQVTRAKQVLSVPLANSLGARLLDESNPAAGAWFEVGELADNGVGGLHAAALAAVLELSGYLALLPHLSTVEHAVTHAVSTQLVAGATAGDRVEVRSEVDRRGNRVAFVSAHATVDGKTIARSQLTKSIVRLTPGEVAG